MVSVAQSVEPRIVIPVVAGSIPVAHPNFPFIVNMSHSVKALAVTFFHALSFVSLSISVICFNPLAFFLVCAAKNVVADCI